MISKKTFTNALFTLSILFVSAIQATANSSTTNIIDAPGIVAAANALDCTGTVTITTGTSDPNYVYKHSGL